MIELDLTQSDMARIRFAHSPVWELMTSLRRLQDRRGDPVYGRWQEQARIRLRGVRIDLLRALIRPGPYVPDFLTPPPTVPDAAFEDELAVIARTEPAVVRQELEPLLRGTTPALRSLFADPAGLLPAVLDDMRSYWHAAIEPFWPRVRTLALADIAHRLDAIAEGGLTRMLAGLSPSVRLDGGRLLIRRPAHADLTGTRDQGIVLLPSAFVWPTVMHTMCSDYQPALCYPVRGLARLYGVPRRGSGSLGALLGRTRAGLLVSLEGPRTTTELAVQLAVTPSAVSQHLKILNDSALVFRRRQGRSVLYQRTAAGATLLAAAVG